MKDEIIRVLNELKEKRTHCQCSRDKVVEKTYFEQVIKMISALPESVDIPEYIQKEQDAVPVRNNDLRIRYTVYGYAVAIAKKVRNEERSVV